MGDGTRRSATTINNVITTIAGNGSTDTAATEAVKEASLFIPFGIALGPDGSLYIADKDNHESGR